jgi:hypothetical protein
VQPLANAAPGGLGHAYRLGPDGKTFIKPITFTFLASWSDAPIDQLTIAYQDAKGYWIRPADVKRDVAAKTLTVTSTHFSDWAIVSADPTRDMTGSFVLDSRMDLPFTASGAARLTYYGEDAHERVYVLSGTTTLQQPVPPAGPACSLDDPATLTFPSNVAEVLNSPDRFWWGTSAHWNLTCGGAPTFVDNVFDTVGINFTGCTRQYLPTLTSPTPIITLDRLQGAYEIDCGASRGTIAATWDFVRCGGNCQSTSPCHTAAISCTSGAPVCTDTGNLANGTNCGPNAVCGDGTCNSCTVGAPCAVVGAPCHIGINACDAGFPVCTDTGVLVANGITCGTNQVCFNGACNICSAGQPCVPADPCHVGATSCATGQSVCVDMLANIANGTTCGTNQVCLNGTCNTCIVNAACTPTNPCHVGTTSCVTGTQACADTGTDATNGTTCGTNQVCLNGACNACTADVACTPAGNPCDAGVTSCTSGSQQCVDTRTPLPEGTNCGADAVCSAGGCTACTAGLACTPTNPCDAGITSCATGTQQCLDTGVPVGNGSLCGTNLVCDAGACSACTAGLVCTPANPCHAGTTSCATGTQQCVDTGANVQDGTSCGAGQVCSVGTCNPCAAGATCVPADACDAGVISCTTGTAVCTDTGANSAVNGTTCGTNQVCLNGTCSPCTAGVACTPTNACHAGTTSCATGTSTCSDTGTPLADGWGCGSNLVCSAGTCAACTQGEPCTLVNTCTATATVECSSGVPVCTARVSAADGTECGAGLACGNGSCINTACTVGAACIPTNPCHVGAVSCGDAAATPPVPPSCTDTIATIEDGTTCGTNLVCRTGECLACPASAGTPCVSTNPCAQTAAYECDAVGVPTCTTTSFKPDGTTCNGTLTCIGGVCQ